MSLTDDRFTFWGESGFLQVRFICPKCGGHAHRSLRIPASAELCDMSRACRRSKQELRRMSREEYDARIPCRRRKLV